MSIDKNNLDFNVFEDGVCATGDQFIKDKKDIETIKEKTNTNVVDMEAFATAQVVREFDLLNKLIIIKAVSDSADEKAYEDSENNLDIAMKNSILVLEKVVNEIL